VHAVSRLSTGRFLHCGQRGAEEEEEEEVVVEEGGILNDGGGARAYRLQTVGLSLAWALPCLY
jgi:hypothetical protein